MNKMEFFSQVYEIVADIPSGRVATYGQIAWLIGRPKCARQVGQAMHYAPKGIPSHRVVNSSGRTAPGFTEQRGLLMKEGVVFKNNGCVDLGKSRWELAIFL